MKGRKKFAKKIATQIAMEFLAQAKPARRTVAKARAPTKPKVEAVAPTKSVPIKITANVLAHARRSAKRKAKVHPFTIAQHPPGVVPEGRPAMAQDEALGAANAWAANSLYAGAFQEGLTFLGYAYLSELAQRPEYRVISETIATEMTRKWIKLQASGDEDKTDKIKLIEAEMKRLKVQDAFREIAEQDGFFGRAHLYLDIGVGTIDDLDELKTPVGNGTDTVSKAKVSPQQRLTRIKTVEAVWCYPSNYNSTDPLRPDWYKPSMWFVQGKEVHASRLLTFVGREVPDLIKPAYSFGGLSLSQMAKPYVDNWLRTRQSVSDLVSSFSVRGVKTKLSESLQAGGEQIFDRATLFNLTCDNQGIMLLDKETEDFFNITTPLTGLDVLQAQAQEHMASVSRIPLVKLLGISPAGLNASSEGELESFDDTIGAYQVAFFTPNLTRVINFIQLSLFGEVDPSITFAYEALSSIDEKERAEVEKIQAETDQIFIDAGIVSPAEARQRVANDPNAGYNSLDVDVVPDLGEEEADGLEPVGGHPDAAAEAVTEAADA